MKDTITKKGLITLIKKMQAEAKTTKIKLSEVNRDYANKIQSIERIQAQIDAIDNDDTIRLSEHALTRYFERVKGYSIEEIEKTIISEELRLMVKKLGGNGTYPLGEHKLVMKDHTITTIL